MAILQILVKIFQSASKAKNVKVKYCMSCDGIEPTAGGEILCLFIYYMTAVFQDKSAGKLSRFDSERPMFQKGNLTS